MRCDTAAFGTEYSISDASANGSEYSPIASVEFWLAPSWRNATSFPSWSQPSFTVWMVRGR